MSLTVIIFGTGSSSSKVKRILNSNTTKLVGYADNNIKIQDTFIEDVPVYSPNQLNKIEFDYIIIGSIYFDEIYEQLINLRIGQTKIINIYEYIRYNDVKLSLAGAKDKDVNTLITGISYARYGYDEENLCESSLNMGFNSQDIFYDYCIALHLLKKGYTFKNAFVSLAYYSFQFDLVLSKEKHLVNRYTILTDVQKLVDKDKFEVLIKPLIEKKEHLNFPEILFVENFISKFDELNHNERVVKDLTQDRKSLAKVHSSKNYPKTVLDNKVLFEKYLMLLVQHNIRPIIVIHPQEKTYRSTFDSKMIKEFNQIIEGFSKKYNLIVVDLFADVRFKAEDFYDVHHLNKEGAKKVSKIMNEYLGE